MARGRVTERGRELRVRAPQRVVYADRVAHVALEPLSRPLAGGDVGLRAGEALLGPREVAREHGLRDRVLRREVLVERRLRDADVRRDVVDARGSEAALGHERRGRVEDGLLTEGALSLLPGGAGRGSRGHARWIM